MGKVSIDGSLCTGCGLCASNCPEVFEIKDDNIVHIISERSGVCNIVEIAEQCPVSAIIVKAGE